MGRSASADHRTTERIEMRITSPRPMALVVAATASLLALGACSEAAGDSDIGNADELVIDTKNGPVSVPRNPERVVVLDNTAMETVRDLGVDPVALPKPLLPREGFAEWVTDTDILDVGNHREPNLEIVSEAAPDLIIGGHRFEEFTSELESIAPVIDIAPDDTSEEGYVAGLRSQTLALGEIFDATDEAEALVAELDAAIDAAKAATAGETVFLAVASGNVIDDGAGRIGRISEPLNLIDACNSEDLDAHAVHQDTGRSAQ